MTETNATGASPDLKVVRDALRAQLTARGYRVASDTLGMRRELYLIGDDDLARALFEFATDAGELAMAMYMSSGSWGPGVPPRFAFLPAGEIENPSCEMLGQIRAIPLFFDLTAEATAFRDLDRLLAEHVGG